MDFKIQFTHQNLQSNTGLSIIAKLLRKINIKDIFKLYRLDHKSNSADFSDADILMTFIGLVCSGNPYFQAIDFFKNDQLFPKAFNLAKPPSKETLRQRIDYIASNSELIWQAMDKINFKLLKRFAKPLPINNTDLIPVDFDVTVMDNTGSHKEGVEQSYRPKIHGYAPIMTNIGKQGFLLNHQFRKGAAHSNCKGSLEYIIASMAFASALCPKQKLLARFDSGNDSDRNIIALSLFDKASYIIKKHLKGKNTKHSKETLIQQVINNYSSKIILPDNTVRYFAEIPTIAGMFDENDQLIKADSRLILSVVEINNDINNKLQALLIPYRSLHMWRTNLPKSEFSPQDIINLYKDHATSEQFHSEFKSDLDLERLPSSNFKTNQLIVALSQIAFNLLRIIGLQALQFSEFNPHFKFSRIKIRTVLSKIIAIPSKLIRKHKQWTICLPRSNPISFIFNYIYAIF